MPVRDAEFILDCSPFVAGLAERHPGWLDKLEAEGRLRQDLPPDAQALAEAIAEHGLDAGLRWFRNREMLRICWRELQGAAALEQTMADLSRMAELCLDAAIDAQHAELAARWGAPHDEEGKALFLTVLGLGKLGGHELNLSSDIDLVLCYPHDGQCDGPRKLSANEFFTRLARAVVRSLSEVTPEGFCFRVDTRLRPFGDSGPLVCSFGAMEQYYQRDGRDWERYALIKARPVAGDRSAGRKLLELLTPFVYRRYIDFGAVESLREMLGSIHADAARTGRETDVKRGPGGIREVEFLVQCLQLLRGGREPALRTPRLLQALDAAGELGLFPARRVAELRADYCWLRRLENAVQALHDQQTHVVPDGEDGQRVARIMGCADQAELSQQLLATRSRVSRALAESFPEPGDDSAASTPWRGQLADFPALRGKPLDDFTARMERISLSTRANARLERFMPLLLSRMAERAMDAQVQDDVLELVHAVCRRSAYLSLLVENPRALDRMLELFTASAWIAHSVIRHPALLDELIDPALGMALPGSGELQASMQRMLDQHQDTESALLALNEFKSASQLRIAVAELAGALPTPDAEARLSELAQALLGGCQLMAERLMHERHGRLGDAGLAMIAYGTLGAREMSYASDLDIIFLYAALEAASDGRRPLLAEPYFTRQARRLLGLATTPSPAGRLYDIDTRLRPNGRAGLLVSSLDAFRGYQVQEAWTWELQALVRARPIAGDAAVGAAFVETRKLVLGTARDPARLRQEVRDMRQRMRAEFDAGDPCKHGFGALVDIDFVAQLGVLETASQAPQVLEHTGSTELLEALAGCGWMARAEADTLVDTHRALARTRHLRALAREPGLEMPATAASWEICRKFLE